MQPGRHDVKIIAHQLGRSPEKKTPFVAVTLETAEKDRITYYGYLSAGAIGHTLKALKTMGWNAADHDGRLDSLNGTNVLVGNKVSIVVEEEEYEGKKYPRVRWVNELGRVGGEKMSADEAAEMAVRLRGKALNPETVDGLPF